MSCCVSLNRASEINRPCPRRAFEILAAGKCPDTIWAQQSSLPTPEQCFSAQHCIELLSASQGFRQSRGLAKNTMTATKSGMYLARTLRSECTPACLECQSLLDQM